MKVVLTKDVGGLGRTGEIKNVSDGYARNFLIPKQLAQIATDPEVKRIEKEMKEKSEKQDRQREKNKDFFAKMSGSIFYVKAKTSGKHLFAGIHQADIKKLLEDRYKIELDIKWIKLKEAIKDIGTHEITIADSTGESVIIKLEIQPQ
jgi:large subunit ribosomal protein L9